MEAPASFDAVKLSGALVNSLANSIEMDDEPSVNETERNAVGTNVELTPLLRDSLRETENGGLGSGVVRLADVPVQARGRGDIDDGAVLLTSLQRAQ